MSAHRYWVDELFFAPDDEQGTNFGVVGQKEVVLAFDYDTLHKAAQEAARLMEGLRLQCLAVTQGQESFYAYASEALYRELERLRALGIES